MGIFAKLKSPSKNINNLKLTSKSTREEQSEIIELDMSTKEASADEREEGEIIDEFEDIISSDEEFSMRKRIEELEAKNAELEKIANISASAIYASGGYNDYPKKDSHHLDRYPLVSIDISDDEDYPPAPKMPRISKRRKSMQHSSSRHSSKLLHTSSGSSNRRRKRSSSPPPAPSYRQSDKLLLSLFHERVASQNSHSSKRKRKSKKTHTKSSRRKSREYNFSDSNDDYFDSYNADDNSHERLNTSDCDKSYSLNRDELRVALARNTHRIEQHASLKDRLTRKKENTNTFNFVSSVEDLPPQKEVVVDLAVQEDEEEEQQQQTEKPISPVEEEKPESEDNLEEQELRILALKSAVLKKHMVRKKRNENVAYSPSDFDEIYKCINESPTLNNIDEQETCNSMEISPVPSPKMILSDDGGGIDTKPVDMDIANSDSECELPSYDKWIPIEQIPLPNSIEVNEEIYNPTPMRYNNDQQNHLMPPDMRFESASVSPKNFDSDVDEEEFALRALLLAKMNSPKVNKSVKEPPPKIIQQVQSPDPDVSLEAEALRNFLIDNMKKKAKPQNSSASVLKEAVRRLTGRNASSSPTDNSNQIRCQVKTSDETEMELSQAITDMAKVKIGFELKQDTRKNEVSSGLIRVRNIESLRAPQRDAEQSGNVIPKIVINQENRNSKENPISTNNQKTSNEPEKFQSINFGANKILVKKETLLAKENNSNNVLKSVSNENNKSANVAIPGKTAKTISPSILEVVTQNIAVKANSDSKKMGQIESDKAECQPILEISPSELSTSDIIESKQEKEVPNKEVHVKVEKEKSNENGSLTSKLEKQIPSKTVIQETSDSNDVAVVESESSIQTSKIVKERVSTPENYEDVDPKETEDKISKASIIQNKDQEDLPENEALTEKDDSAEKEAFTEKDGTKNVVVKNVDEITSKINLENIASTLIEKEHKVDILLEHKISDVALETKDITKVQSVNASILLKQIGPTRIVDPKDMEKDLTNKALEESPNKEIVSEATKSVLEVDTTEPSEAGVNQSLLIHKVNTEDVVSDTKISKTNVIQEITSEFSTIEDSTSTSYSNLEETMIDVNSNTTSKSDVKTIQHKEKICNELNEKQIVLESISKPVETSNTSAVSPPTTSQVQRSTKSIEVKLQPKKIVGTGNKAVQTKTQNVSKSQSIQKATEKVQNSDKPLIKSTMSTPKKILPSTAVVVAQKPTTKLPTQQPITIRTKIVKPNKVINQQQPMELKRKTVDTNLPQTSVPPKKPKTDDTNRLITTAEIPKVPDLIIQLRASESESEYSELGAEDMEEDEDEQVHNFFNRSITIGNEYYDIASPISLPMESPCNTPTNSNSPMVSRTQTPQPPVEKSIVNDYFEAKLEQFLKTVRSKVSVSDNNTTIKSTLFEGQEITSTNSTPVAVRHLPESSQQEYRRLINRMKMLERQKQAKNLQVEVKASDAGAGSDSRLGLTDGDSKFLVRKVLVKNATAKPAPIVIQKSSSPGKTEQQNIQKPSSPPKSVKSPQKSNTSPVSQDTAKSKENLLVLYENSYRKTGASIIASLDKSIQMVQVAKIAKMGKLKCEQRLKELRKEMEEVQKNLKTQQEKITKIYPEICNSHRAIESLKTRRTKINKAVTALGKSVIGPNYSMKNDQKSIISERSKKLAAEIKFVNTMKISDIEAALATPKRTNLPENAKTIVAPAQQNINKTIDEKHPAISLQTQDPPQKDKESIEIQMPANSLQEEQIPAHTSNMAPSSTLSPSSPTIENEVPACDSESSPESLNKTVPEDIEEDHMNITIVPEILSNKDDDDKASSTTTNGHEEALELEQPVVVVGGDNDNKNNIEQAPDQTNMDENIEEENGDLQVGSAKLHDYVSPLSHLRDERHINPNGVVCPYQLMGQCDDKDCKYMHLED